jgi:hypothetical protein
MLAYQYAYKVVPFYRLELASQKKNKVISPECNLQNLPTYTRIAGVFMSLCRETVKNSFMQI